MGGAVSSGRDNNELIDNLMGGNYIRTRSVERVFRVLDRADYMTPEARDQAYKDLAWRNGPLHMSAPCIYSEVMEGLELQPGLSFLNVGSGTGYLSTLVGLILGSGGISHGVEVHPIVVEYATKKLSQFLENSPTLDEFDFCEPKFYTGNGLCLAPLQAPYDRVYCGAGCPEQYQNYFKQLIKVGGLLVMPLNDNLIQVRRVSESEWVTRSLLNVSFATLREPTKEEAADLIKLDEQTPPRLQILARAVIRSAMREGLMRRHPELREPLQRAPAAKKACPRRICIPIEDDSDVEGLNALHELDRDGGAREMNALLSLVLSMGQNRVAGALRFDPLDSPIDSSTDDDDEGGGGEGGGDDDDGDDGSGGEPFPISVEATPNLGEPPREQCTEDLRTNNPRSRRGLLTFEFRDMVSAERSTLSWTPDGDAPAGPTGEGPTEGPTEAEQGDSQKDQEQKEDENQERADGDASGSQDRSERKDEPRSSTSRDDNPDDDDDDHAEGPSVPADVEIYLSKAIAGISSDAHMDWEEAAGSSESEEEETKSKEDKRQKLDSGIGEETTPTSEASPGKSDSKTDESDSRHDDSLTDDVDDKRANRRRQKRVRCLGTGSGSSTECTDASESDAAASRAKRRARAPPPRRPPPGPDRRRVRLSLGMKRAVKELPLPYALKRYVNLGRCFEF